MGLVAAAHLALLCYMALARSLLVPADGSWMGLLNGLAAWDAQHYLTVAREGYVQEHLIVRLPLLPLLIRAVALVVRDVTVAGYLVVFACHVAAGWLLHALLRLDETEAVARRALVAWLVAPAAFSAVVPLTEAPFFLGVVGTLYFWRRDRPRWAALFALVAVLARLPGVVLLAALAGDALLDRRPGRSWKDVALVLAAPLAGLLAFLALNMALERDALHFVEVQRRQFFRSPGSPGIGFMNALRRTRLSPPDNLTQGVFEVLGAALAWAGAAYAVVRRQKVEALYAVLSALLFTCTTFWISNLRYAYVIPSVYPLLGRLTGPLPARALVLGLSLALLAALSFQFSRGWWAT
jgi:hypothetical protein